jgi:protein-disulfide isomerase
MSFPDWPPRIPQALPIRGRAAEQIEDQLSNGTSDGQSRNDRRDAAREKARLQREQQKKKDRRTRVFLQGGIILAVIGVVAMIALILSSSIHPAGPGPKNVASDGIQISQGDIALNTPALASGAVPIPNPVNTTKGVINIQIYVDYLCPVCGQFEKTNGAYISSLIDNGAATVEIHPIAILDRSSQGTKYSTRATNAAACVANFSPNEYYALHTLLYANQPPENSTGLTDDQLIDLTTQAKVTNQSQVTDCIRKGTFATWVAASTARALNGPIPNSNVTKINGTPTVIVNGAQYPGAVDDLSAFQAFVIQAAGDTFNQNSTPTPTPTPTPSS